jgi:transcription initiation factor IIE alpha subunit
MKKVLLIAAVLFSITAAFTACNNDKSKDSTQKETLTGDEMYTCSMHNEVMSDKPGKCPKCDMDLVKQKMTEEQKKMMKEGTHTKPKE